MKKLFLILSTFSLLFALTACELVSRANPCAPPDGTYPYSTNGEWQGLAFEFAYCWEIEEELAQDEPFRKDTLTLTRGDDSLWVSISIGSGVTDKKITPTRIDHEGYSVFDYEGHYYVETNGPDDSEVQMILSSLTSSKDLTEACVSSIQAGLDFEYLLPGCWTASSLSEGQLILKDAEGETKVFMHYHEPDLETLGYVSEMTNPEGKTLYIEHVTTLSSNQLHIFLNSITWPEIL